MKTLMLPVGVLKVEFEEGTGWVNSNGAEGWETLDFGLASNLLLGWKGSIDLSGYSLQDKTLFFSGQSIAEVGDWETSNTDCVGIQCMEIVSMVPLDLQTLANEYAPDNGIFPGMPESTYSQENIIVGRYRFLTPFTNQAAAAVGVNYPFVARTQEFGTGEPTSSDRLYFYVLVAQISHDIKNTMRIPSRRFILAGVPVKEPDLEYMMRQRRSYHLQE